MEKPPSPPLSPSPQKTATRPHKEQTTSELESWAQDCSYSKIFLKPFFRGNFDSFVNNANLGATTHTSNGTQISIVYRKKCCNLRKAFKARRLRIGKNKHPTCYILAINPRTIVLEWSVVKHSRGFSRFYWYHIYTLGLVVLQLFKRAAE